MLYRTVGQFKTSYHADHALFPVKQDAWLLGFILLLAFVVLPATANEFVFKAYHHHQSDAIFLAGIPDLKATLPHA